MSEAARIHSYTYSCEKCGEGVTLSHTEFIAQKHTKHGAKILCYECQVPAVVEPPTPLYHRPRQVRPASLPAHERTIGLTPRERQEFGAIVTIREQSTREMRTLTDVGPVGIVLTNICTQIDKLEGDWRVVTISTPGSIYTDLQGSRNTERTVPEAPLLGRIKRGDLLEHKAS